jgi:hypothetical protein
VLKFDPGNSCLSSPRWHGSWGGDTWARLILPWELAYPCTYYPVFNILKLLSPYLQSSYYYNLLYLEQRTALILQSYLNLHSNDNLNDFFLVSAYLGDGNRTGDNLRIILLPLHLFAHGGAGECGWLDPSRSSVLANVRVGAGNKGQPLQTTILYLSYVLSSMFPGLCIPNLFSPYLLGVSCFFSSPLHWVQSVPWQSYTKKALPSLDHKEHPSLTI